MSSLIKLSKHKLKKKLHEKQKETKKLWKQDKLVKKRINVKDDIIIEGTGQEEGEKVSRFEELSTVSIAIPGSILDNAQSAELRTYLAGQIARAACIFNIDEVIIFDDYGSQNSSTARTTTIETDDGIKTSRHCCVQFTRILQYLECPQYLRKFFFPIHNDLKFSGLLNPLDAQHHLRQQSDFIYREGVVTNKPTKEGNGSFVNVGLLNDIKVDQTLTPGLRVTVKLEPGQDLKSKKLAAKIVSPSEPRRNTGIYWGYNVRIVNSLSEIFSGSHYENGYDLSIGTSDKGIPISEIEDDSLSFKHALIVFGGVMGLNPALENDNTLNVDDPALLFDQYVNTVPGQGSRTIRTEEALLISMAALNPKLKALQKPPKFDYVNSIPHSEDTGVQQYAFNKPIQRNSKKTGKNMNRFD